MSGKTTQETTSYIAAGDMSGTITGSTLDIWDIDLMSFQIDYTGTPTGTFSVEVSNDEATWTELTLSTAVLAAGSADNHFIDCETSARYIRLKYTFTSGTGSLDAKSFGKSRSN